MDCKLKSLRRKCGEDDSFHGSTSSEDIETESTGVLNICHLTKKRRENKTNISQLLSVNVKSTQKSHQTKKVIKTMPNTGLYFKGPGPAKTFETDPQMVKRKIENSRPEEEITQSVHCTRLQMADSIVKKKIITNIGHVQWQDACLLLNDYLLICQSITKLTGNLGHLKIY